MEKKLHLNLKIGAEGKIDDAEKFILRVANQLAEQKKLPFYLETLRLKEDLVINSTRIAKGILSCINNSWLGIHLDTFHAESNDRIASHALKVGGAYVGYVHASGTNRSIPGDKDDKIDWDDVALKLTEINFQGWVTVEAFGQGAAAEIPDIVTGLSTPKSVTDILAISGKTLRKAGIIAPLK